MASKVFSFSSSKAEEIRFIEKTKAKYDKQGVSFSYIVKQALKQYEEAKMRGAAHE